MNSRLVVALLVISVSACTPAPATDGGVVVTDSGMPVAFAVASTTPANAAVDVALVPALIVQFTSPATMAQLSLSPAHATMDQLDVTGLTLVSLPVGKLMPSTEYTATITAQNAAGAMTTRAFTFTTVAAVVDTTGPMLVASTPTQAEQNVSGARRLTLTFSEPINPATFAVTATPAVDLGPVSWVNAVAASFSSPAASWTANTPYSIAITADDLAGNRLTTTLTFTTSQDVIPPTVIANSPNAGANGVTTSVIPTLTFSEPMDATAITAISVVPSASFMFSLDSTGRVLKATHGGLAPTTAYTVTVTTGALDRAGNGLAAPFVFAFTTGSMADTTAPTVMSATPAAMSLVRPCEPLAVTFSEDMERNSVERAVGLTNHDGGLQFQWPDDGGSRIVSVTAMPELPRGMQTWTIGAAATDLAGNALNPTFSRATQVMHQTRFATLTTSVDFGLRRQTNGTITEDMSTAFAVGDDAMGAEDRGFLVFDLTGLPHPVTIRSAVLNFWVNSNSGNTFGPGGSGAPVVEVINSVGAHATWWNAAAMATPPVCGVCGCDPGQPGPSLLLPAPMTGPRSFDLIREVSAFVNAGAGTTFPSLQLRIRPQNGTNSDAVRDSLSFAAHEYVATCPAPNFCESKLTIEYYEP